MTIDKIQPSTTPAQPIEQGPSPLQTGAEIASTVTGVAAIIPGGQAVAAGSAVVAGGLAAADKLTQDKPDTAGAIQAGTGALRTIEAQKEAVDTAPAKKKA